MPIKPHAKKKLRHDIKRYAINKARRSRIRTFIKSVIVAVASGNKSDAQKAFKNAQPEIHRGVTKGILHKNTAARKISGLSAKVKNMALDITS